MSVYVKGKSLAAGGAEYFPRVGVLVIIMYVCVIIYIYTYNWWFSHYPRKFPTYLENPSGTRTIVEESKSKTIAAAIFQGYI